MAFVPNMDKQVVGIKWTSGLGMLFIRTLWAVTNTRLPARATAAATGLPLVFQQGFPDLLVGRREKADPETPPSNTSTTAEPITDKALEKWLYWNAKPPREDRTFSPPSGGEIIYYATVGPEVDPALAFEIYPGATDNCGMPVTYMSALGGAFLNCNGSVTAWARKNGWPDLSISDGIGPDRDLVQAYCDAINAFWARGGGTPSTFRVAELRAGGAGDPLYTLTQVGITTLNLSKLRKYQPLGSNDQKPDTMSFTVKAIGGDTDVGGWNIEGWMIRAKPVSGGAKGHATRVFPVSETLYYPQWGPPATGSHGSGTPPDAKAYTDMGKEVTVTINFKTFKLTMSS